MEKSAIDDREDRAGREFWREFCDQAEHVAATTNTGDLNQASEWIGHLLEKHGLRFYHELLRSGQYLDLLISPRCDQEVAKEIDRLFAAGPQIPGWRFYPRRQAVAWEDVILFIHAIYRVEIDDATFDLGERDDGWEVTMYSSGLVGMSDAFAANLVLAFLEYAAGEAVVMSLVKRTTGCANGTGSMRPAELVTAMLAD